MAIMNGPTCVTLQHTLALLILHQINCKNKYVLIEKDLSPLKINGRFERTKFAKHLKKNYLKTS